MSFTFTNSKDLVINVIKNAEKFIKIIAFQFTSELFVKYLIEKSKSGLDIEIITLPEDSYSKQDERKKISEYYKLLKSNNIKLFLCDWEVGDPSLTSTSMSGDLKEGGGNKWYSLHGKLVITEKNTLIMSLNFIDQELYESYLCFNDKHSIDLFLDKYQMCANLFIKKTDKSNILGDLINKLDEQDKEFIINDFNKSKKKIIKHYSPSITPEIAINPGLFISPFEGRLRNILYELINTSEKFLYIVSERLFDSDFVNFIGKKITNSEDLDLKMLTGPPDVVRQNVQKATTEFRQIKVFGGNIRALKDLHAKFWLNEKYLILTSANLTKMNLGFKKQNNYWRANTEFFYISDNPKLIQLAKSEFEKIYQIAGTIEEVLGDSNKALSNAKEYFDLFGFRSRNDAKAILSKFRLKFTIDAEKNIIRIAKFASILAQIDKTIFIEKEHVIMGGILLLLQKRASTARELKEDLSDICSEEQINKNLTSLVHKNYVELEEEVYKINIEQLLAKKENFMPLDKFK